MSVVPAPTRRAFLERATALYERSMTREAATYLVSRGVDKGTAQRFRLGYVGEDYCDGHETYRGRLCIPYLTPSGPVSLRFRALPGAPGAKYLSLTGDPPRLFNVAALLRRTDGPLVVTEGEFDALTVDAHLSVAAIGVPGASTWSPLFTRMLADHSEKVIVGDGDEAGAVFAGKLAEVLEGRRVVMPAGSDVNAFLLEFGPVALREYLGV